jgi:hypothetical protein
VNDALRKYLAEGASRPFAWGEEDCCLFPSGWVLLATGRDPAAPFRGRYRGARRAQRFIAGAGGLAPLVTEAMASIGMAETTSPCAGDVGVVRDQAGDVFAIFTGALWASKALEGLLMGRHEMVRAWSVPCRL